MILGLIAGGWLRSDRGKALKLLYLVIAGLVFLGLGWAADFYGICPSVKRIWTSSWVLYSGGWCFLMLAGFYLALDTTGWHFWAFPLVVVGTNPIVAYCMNDLWEAFIESSLKTHLGQDIFRRWGDPYQSLVRGIFVLASMWLILLWMYRRKIFVRI
jgi:predicted acyltransferase